MKLKAIVARSCWESVSLWFSWDALLLSSAIKKAEVERSTRRKCLKMRMENHLRRMLRGASCGRSYDYDWRSTRDSRRSPWSCPWCRCRCRCRKINQISLHLSIHNMQLYCWGLPSEYGHGRVGFTVSGFITDIPPRSLSTRAWLKKWQVWIKITNLWSTGTCAPRFAHVQQPLKVHGLMSQIVRLKSLQEWELVPT